MRIRLLHSYSGVLTNEKRMAEGEHEVTAELGNYLVDNGHAVDITPAPVAPVTDIRTLDSKMELPPAPEPPKASKRK